MSRGFGQSKRRIEQAKRQKREEKRLKKLNKGAAPATPQFVPEFNGPLPEETPPADTAPTQ